MKYEDIAALHEEVRTLVEKEYPDFKVAEITGYTTTKYHPPRSSLADDPMKLEWLLIDITARFRVEAHAFSGIHRLLCEVETVSNGALVFTDVALRRGN